MRNDNSNRVTVVKCNNKEQMAIDFISTYTSDEIDTDTSDTRDQQTILCLARSPSSPVVKALASLNQTLTDSGISVRAIFSQIPLDQNSACWTDEQSGVTFARDIRMVTRAELLDAHEMLVLSDKTSWVGDCLRREPTKNDAYEYYSSDCSTSANNVQISFERLWQMSEPVVSHQMSSSNPSHDEEPMNIPIEDLDPSMLDESSEDNEPMSATRH